MSPPLLEARKVTKRFGDVAALSDVNLDVHPGEVHALCGENGAGKSTLIRILSGYYASRAFEGQLLLDGKPLRLASVRDGEAAGMAVIHQELTIVKELTVAENLFLGSLPADRFTGALWDWSTTMRRSQQMMERLNAAIDPDTKAGELGIAQHQLVEIGRALARNPRLLILDEPTAALSEAEVEQLLQIVDLLRQEGVACIYISHKLDEVKRIADRITVLRDGQAVITCKADDLAVDDIIKHMVGRELGDVFPTVPGRLITDAVQLSVQQLSAAQSGQHSIELHGVNLQVHAGEILGIGGLMGAGRSELLMHIYGLWGDRTAGTVEVKGEAYQHPQPTHSIQRRIVLLTEDRKRYGLIPTQTANENTSLSSLNQIASLGWIDRPREQQRNAAVLERTRFQALADDVLVDRLSGGNQQKVGIARGLLCDPDIILLDEPTRGIDVGARREIYQEVQHLAKQGKAILWVSSELPELMGICDRIVMMRDGTTTGTFDRGDGFDAAQLLGTALN